MKATLICIALAILLLATSLSAAPRTTPTTVENTPAVTIAPTGNTVKVDPAANTVKIDAANNTVKAAQTGAWSVGVSNTPSVAQGGAWNVGISSAANTVKAPAQSQMIRLWPANQALSPSEWITGPTIDTTGYRQFTVVMHGNWTSPDVDVWIYVRGPDGAHHGIGAAQFSGAGGTIVTGGDFEMSGGHLAFTLPVISDSMYVRVANNSALDVTIYSWAYVYLTN